jgi:hypothetical protein
MPNICYQPRWVWVAVAFLIVYAVYPGLPLFLILWRTARAEVERRRKRSGRSRSANCWCRARG